MTSGRRIWTTIVFLLAFGMVLISCSSETAITPAPVGARSPTPTHSLIPAPTPIPTPTPTPEPEPSSWQFKHEDGYVYAVYLTDFDRSPNPTREGWDQVLASFLLYLIPTERTTAYYPARLDHYDGMIRPRESSGPSIRRGGIGIVLSWDGGSVTDFQMVGYVGAAMPRPYFKAIPCEIKTDVPTVAGDLELVPITTDGAWIRSVGSEIPRICKPEFLWTEYDRFVDEHLLSFADLWTAEVAYYEIDRRLEAGHFVVEIDVTNRSMQADLRLDRIDVHYQGVSPYLLTGDGTDLGPVPDQRTYKYFDFGGRQVLPPGFTTRGTFTVPVHEADTDLLEYILLGFVQPDGSHSYYGLLSVP